MRILNDPVQALPRVTEPSDRGDAAAPRAAPARGRPALHARGLSKGFGKLQALDGVSLRLHHGEFAALLGPNGAGKTTLFNILTGLVLPDRGTVHILGHCLRKRPHAQQAAIGIVFQQLTVDLDMSVMQNLQFHSRLYGVPRSRRKPRINELLSAVGLAADAERRVRELSGGNRRRVELARALLHEPKLLLLDEPSAGLDPASRSDLLTRVHSLAKTHDCAVLWATQLIEEAEHADTVIVLNRGAITATMSPQELCESTARSTLSEAFLTLTGERNS